MLLVSVSDFIFASLLSRSFCISTATPWILTIVVFPLFFWPNRSASIFMVYYCKDYAVGGLRSRVTFPSE